VTLLDRLREAVGAAHVLTGDLVAGYDRDWTGRWHGEPLAVVRPRSTGEVAAVVRACAEARVPIVPQGGNTGLVGAASPADGEVVLATGRLTGVGVPDPVGGTIEAGAGVPLETVRRAAAAGGLEVGIDLASRGTATIGGVVATNAGGARVLRHGTTRAQVLGLEAVLADGSVVGRLAGLPKDNTGYDLTQLLVGSEGTLGVITRAVLRVTPAPPARAAALVAVDGIEAAVRLLVALRSGVDGLDAVEFVTAEGVDLVVARGLARLQFAGVAPVCVLAEAVGPSAAAIADTLATAVEPVEGVLDAAVATTESERAGLWALREGHTEALAPLTPVKLDVAVPVPAMPAFVAALPPAVTAAAPGARPISFGHLAEGNVHVNVVGVPPAREDAVTAVVLELVADLGGSISAEHGIGRAKRAWLHLGRSGADIAAMRAVKHALDPGGLLSPGRVLPEEQR
jgi:FAD/FMN-containing dehydrogenase